MRVRRKTLRNQILREKEIVLEKIREVLRRGPWITQAIRIARDHKITVRDLRKSGLAEVADAKRATTLYPY